MDSPQYAQPVKRGNILVGESLGLGIPKGDYYDSGETNLVQKTFRRDCDAVFKFASPRDPTLSTITSELARKVSADLETRMSAIAQRSEFCTYSTGQAYYTYPHDINRAANSVDAWTKDILEWATYENPTECVDSQGRDDYATDYTKAYIVAPYYEAFLLFVAHQVKEHTSEYIAAGRIKPEDCRLILPIANEGAKYDDDYIHPSDRAFIDSAERHLVKKTKTLYPDQHNRSFAWGLTVAFRWIRAYVFGPDDIWASSKIDISEVEGRRTFISLLVDWSLSSVDRLGFDPTIRYVLDGSIGVPYLEIDVHNVDATTGRVEKHTYYSKRCIGGAERLTGRHGRCFAVSTSAESMDTPAFFIKNAWTISGGGSTKDMHENSFLNVLHAEFDKSSEFGGSFTQPVSAGPVYINQGDTHVADSTDTAFGGLPDSSKVRQHRRTLVKWAGNPISAAEDPNQVVVAIADAMIALNEAYTKCKIVHGNISDQAILFQKTADGVKGILAEFGYASYIGDGTHAVEASELIRFKSIRSLENPRGDRTRLDDWESILYLICWLGTFGINSAQRREFAADQDRRRAPGFTKRYPTGRASLLLILNWNSDTSSASECKRCYMDDIRSFRHSYLSEMRDSPLRQLAEDIYMALFRHPDCYGTYKVSDEDLNSKWCSDIPDALRAMPAINGKRDPLVLRETYEKEIVEKLLQIVVRHRDTALAALAASIIAGVDKGPAKKSKRDDVPYDGPARRTRSKANR
ncbi:hypothetical protein H4S07_000535 [Coemansia furcata]|uniref:Uncharacterized protein n=1 Tax=Coemansia furcata TaxID=417177 RepID=A0ACC1LR70_9FUNG|nr:hypothetical protein H4S07_000535 [Coemansia furcata]